MPRHGVVPIREELASPAGVRHYGAALAVECMAVVPAVSRHMAGTFPMCCAAAHFRIRSSADAYVRQLSGSTIRERLMG